MTNVIPFPKRHLTDVNGLQTIDQRKEVFTEYFQGLDCPDIIRNVLLKSLESSYLNKFGEIWWNILGIRNGINNEVPDKAYQFVQFETLMRCSFAEDFGIQNFNVFMTLNYRWNKEKEKVFPIEESLFDDLSKYTSKFPEVPSSPLYVVHALLGSILDVPGIEFNGGNEDDDEWSVYFVVFDELNQTYLQMALNFSFLPILIDEAAMRWTEQQKEE